MLDKRKLTRPCSVMDSCSDYSGEHGRGRAPLRRLSGRRARCRLGRLPPLTGRAHDGQQARSQGGRDLRGRRAAGHVSAPLLLAAGPPLQGGSHTAGFREGTLIST